MKGRKNERKADRMKDSMNSRRESTLFVPLTEPTGRSVEAASKTVGGMPLLRLAFRPFYLLGALAAALLPVVWLLQWGQLLILEHPIAGLLWHGHEMLLGVVVAFVVGFLLTAGQTWTGLPTPKGSFLGALALLWLLARLAGLWGPLQLYVVLDLAFLPVVAAIFIDLLVRSGNRRNAPLALVMLLLAAANGVFHAAALGVLPVSPQRALQTAVLLIVVVMSIVGGRVIPAFIGNVMPLARPRVLPGLERWGLPLSALAVFGWAMAPQHAATALALATLATWHVVRWILWQPWVAHSRPILWILPVAYAWIPAGLGLLALASLGWMPASSGIHALAAGAMGALIVGMASRTARGHTGRMLHAGPLERWAYGLVLVGAVLRVAATGAGDPWQWPLLATAALAWSLAFAGLLLTLWPWLTSPRADGRPG